MAKQKKKRNRRKSRKAKNALKMIFAKPGYSLLMYDHVDEKVIQYPVVAWGISKDGMDVYPISIIGLIDITKTQFVLETPTKGVMTDIGEFVGSRADWVNDLKKQNVTALKTTKSNKSEEGNNGVA